MPRFLVGLLAAAGIFSMGIRSLHAQEVAAVLAADIGAYRKTYDSFAAAYGKPISANVLPGSLRFSGQTRVIAAFGGKAVLADYPENIPLVYCLAPALSRSSLERGGQTIEIKMTPAAGILLQQIRMALPSVKRLAVLWSSPQFSEDVEGLRKEGASIAFDAVGYRISGKEDLPKALRRIRGGADAILLLPDPFVITEQNFAAMRNFVQAEGIALIAPTENLVERGATFSVAVDFESLGRSAAAAVDRVLQGRAVSEGVYPEEVSIMVNPAEFKRLGLSLPRNVRVKSVPGSD
ncbi:MAG: ABC transporter substrate binding protein [Elusimicrobiota bacterium]